MPMLFKMRFIHSQFNLFIQEMTEVISETEVVSETEDSEAEVDPQTIWLTEDEFNVDNLTKLFNCSARRKKDKDSLFTHLSSRVHRCQEYPHGIYINQFGELCPDDKRSGIYQPITSDMQPETSEESDQDNDNCRDSADEMWEAEEKKLRARKTGSKRKRIEESEDDDYKQSSADEAEEEVEEVEEEDEDDDDEFVEMIEEEEEEDADWQPSKKRAKKNHIRENSDAEDASVDDDRSVDSVGEEEEEEEDDDEVEKKVENEVNDKVDNKVESHDQPKSRVNLIDDLKSSAELLNHFHDVENQKRKERLKTSKLINYLETFTEEWSEVRKMQHVARADKKTQNMTIKMSYDCNLLSKTPNCHFEFRKPKSGRKYIKAELDCDKINVVCQCGCADFKNTEAIYHHIATHFEPVTATGL